MAKFGNFLLGIVLGAVVGSATAMLLAPESGGEIRSQLKDYKDGLTREMRQAAMKKRLEMETELARLRAGGPRDITIE